MPLEATAQPLACWSMLVGLHACRSAGPARMRGLLRPGGPPNWLLGQSLGAAPAQRPHAPCLPSRPALLQRPGRRCHSGPWRSRCSSQQSASAGRPPLTSVRQGAAPRLAGLTPGWAQAAPGMVAAAMCKVAGLLLLPAVQLGLVWAPRRPGTASSWRTRRPREERSRARSLRRTRLRSWQGALLPQMGFTGLPTTRWPENWH